MALPKSALTPQSIDWVARDFRFHTGEVMPELRLHFTTMGDPGGEPVLVLHGTGSDGASLMAPGFGGELFGSGRPLDAGRYFVILPDAIGHGASSKPSDGLRASFPRYNYDDMVSAQHRLLTEGLGVRHLRLVLGNSMGGMHAWLWGTRYAGFMDALVPMACQPAPVSGRNWMMRRLLIDSVRNDPAWNGGNYSVQPPSLRAASVFFGIATNGGSCAWHRMAPTREAADRLLDQRLAAPFAPDANDWLCQWEASRDYDPSAGLERIEAAVLAINSADDERNPPELRIMERELRRVKNARLFLIPGSEDTCGHATTNLARLWKDQLRSFLQSVPHAPR